MSALNFDISHLLANSVSQPTQVESTNPCSHILFSRCSVPLTAMVLFDWIRPVPPPKNSLSQTPMSRIHYPAYFLCIAISLACFDWLVLDFPNQIQETCSFPTDWRVPGTQVGDTKIHVINEWSNTKISLWQSWLRSSHGWHIWDASAKLLFWSPGECSMHKRKLHTHASALFLLMDGKTLTVFYL